MSMMAAIGDKQLQRKCIMELDPAGPPGQLETDMREDGFGALTVERLGEVCTEVGRSG